MISEKPWTPIAVIRLFLAIIMTACLGLLLVGGLEKLNLGLSRTQIDSLDLLLPALLVQGTALGWIALFLKMHTISWTNAFGFLQSTPVKVAAYGLIIGALFVPIAWGLQTISQYTLKDVGVDAEEQAAVQELQDPKVSPGMKVALGFLAVIIAPLAEETLFRGIIFTTLRQRGYTTLAWWGTSALFAVMHFNSASFLSLLMLAMVLNFLYEAYGNLIVPIMAHFIFNGANFIYLMYEKPINNFVDRVFHWQ